MPLILISSILVIFFIDIEEFAKITVIFNFVCISQPLFRLRYVKKEIWDDWGREKKKWQMEM